MARLAARATRARVNSRAARGQGGGLRAVSLGVLLAVSTCIAGLWLLTSPPGDSVGGTSDVRSGSAVPDADARWLVGLGLAGLLAGTGAVWLLAGLLRRGDKGLTQRETPPPTSGGTPASAPDTDEAARKVAGMPTSGATTPAQDDAGPAARPGATAFPAHAAPAPVSLGRIVAVGVNCAAGEDLQAWQEKQSRGLCLARPHPSLRHLDGLPVIAVHPAIDGLHPWQQQVDREPELRRLREKASPLTQRALAAVSPALQRVLPKLHHMAPVLPSALPDNDFQLRRAVASPKRTATPSLHVVWIGPPASPADVALVRALLTAAITPSLTSGTDWSIHFASEPAEVVLQQAAQRAFSVQSGRASASHAQQIEARPWQLILAAHSDLDGDHIHALEVAGRIFHGLDRPDGEWASEAAVALLWAPDPPADGTAAPGPRILDLRVADARSQVTGTDPWPALVACCLEQSSAAGFEAMACTSDVAPRTEDMAAWARAVADLHGRWDATTDVGFTASTAGRGPIASVLALAAAAERAKQRPTLLVSGTSECRLVACLTSEV